MQVHQAGNDAPSGDPNFKGGRWMTHCHNLPHEDHDMMGQFSVGTLVGDIHHPIDAAKPWLTRRTSSDRSRPRRWLWLHCGGRTARPGLEPVKVTGISILPTWRRGTSSRSTCATASRTAATSSRSAHPRTTSGC